LGTISENLTSKLLYQNKQKDERYYEHETGETLLKLVTGAGQEFNS
jgi:hypothetical protein